MKIIIAPYDPEWPELFLTYRKKIEAAVDVDASIEHIGSTSVPGLAAKPVIDIQVGVGDVTMLNGLITRMTNAGFTFMLKYEHLLPERRYFVLYESADHITPPQILDVDGQLPDGFINVAHIHCWVKDSEDYERHIAFRDYLRQHEAVKREYQQLKEELAKQEWESSLAYSQAKNEFIKRVEADALAWYRAQTR